MHHTKLGWSRYVELCRLWNANDLLIVFGSNVFVVGYPSWVPFRLFPLWMKELDNIINEVECELRLKADPMMYSFEYHVFYFRMLVTAH